MASLARGTFQQRCFDADCREQGFRGSDELPIPPGVLQAASTALVTPSTATPELDLANDWDEGEGWSLQALAQLDAAEDKARRQLEGREEDVR